MINKPAGRRYLLKSMWITNGDAHVEVFEPLPGNGQPRRLKPQIGSQCLRCLEQDTNLPSTGLAGGCGPTNGGSKDAQGPGGGTGRGDRCIYT